MEPDGGTDSDTTNDATSVDATHRKSMPRSSKTLAKGPCITVPTGFLSRKSSVQEFIGNTKDVPFQKCQPSPLLSTVPADRTIDLTLQEEEFEKAFRKEFERKLRDSSIKWTERVIDTAKEALELYKDYPYNASSIPKVKRHLYTTYYYYQGICEVIKNCKKSFLILKRKTEQSPIIIIPPLTEYYDIIKYFYEKTGEKRTNALTKIVQTEFFIPHLAIHMFLTMKESNVIECGAESPNTVLRNRGIVTLVYILRGEHKGVLHYQNQMTGFSQLRLLVSLDVHEISKELLQIFLEDTCPEVIETQLPYRISCTLITTLRSTWPDCKILNTVTNKIDHSESSSNIKQMFRKWMTDNKSRNWTMGINDVECEINSKLGIYSHEQKLVDNIKPPIIPIRTYSRKRKLVDTNKKENFVTQISGKVEPQTTNIIKEEIDEEHQYTCMDPFTEKVVLTATTSEPQTSKSDINSNTRMKETGRKNHEDLSGQAYLTDDDGTVNPNDIKEEFDFEITIEDEGVQFR